MQGTFKIDRLLIIRVWISPRQSNRFPINDYRSTIHQVSTGHRCLHIASKTDRYNYVFRRWTKRSGPGIGYNVSITTIDVRQERSAGSRCKQLVHVPLEQYKELCTPDSPAQTSWSWSHCIPRPTPALGKRGQGKVWGQCTCSCCQCLVQRWHLS